MKKPVLTSTGEQCFAANGSVLLTAIGTRKSQRNRLLLFQSPLTKTLFSLFFTVSCWLWSGDAFAQWIVPEFTAPGIYDTDSIKITYMGGTNLGGTTDYKGYIGAGNNIHNAGNHITSALSTVPLSKQFKAQAGKTVTIKLEFKLKNNVERNALMTGYKALIVGVGVGPIKDEPVPLYIDTTNIRLNPNSVGDTAVVDFNGRRHFNYTGNFTFPVGRTTAWIVISYNLIRNNFNYPGTIVLPFVVEGAAVQQVPIVGTTREPAIPYMVLHAPPGDQSFATFETNREVCRTFSETASNSQSQNASLSVTLGTKASIGVLFVSTDFENTVTATASGSTNQTKTKTTSTQKCISVLSKIQTALGAGTGAAEADNRSIFIGTSATIEYGIYPYVKIDNTTNTPTSKLETGLVFSYGAPEAFFWTKQDIKNDIAAKQNIINSLNPNHPKKDSIRFTTMNQIKIWNQVLTQDSLNKINPNNEPISTEELLGAKGPRGTATTVSTNTTTTLEVTRFIEGSAAVNFQNQVGGIGAGVGYQFTTTKSFGSSTTTSTNNSTTIGYNLEDDDDGDVFPLKIVRDPTYGTPIFIISDNNRFKTSCPYEGGYQRDQPRFEIVGISPNKKDTTISNVSLGTSGTFRVRVCNDNIRESRSYDFGFLGQSINTDLKITSSGSEGNQLLNLPITKFVKINDIPAGGCINQTYDINMSRRHAASAMSYSNIEFQLYRECEPAIKSSLFANINFAGPPPPTGVAATPSEICSGLPTTLTANCAVTTTPTWYTEVTGGFPIATGATVTVNPTANTRYYVGCETPDYKRDRIATKLVLVTTPVTNLNLTADYTVNTFQLATQALTATNKVIAPAGAIYRAGKAITLNSGFEARNGAIFRAEIGGCN